MNLWAATNGVADAPHIVLIHGSLDRSAGMLKLARRLTDRYRVTRYDRRGYGRSMPCEGPYGIAAQVGDLVQVLSGVESAGLPRVIVGHSYGGNVALAAVAADPTLADGVITYESPMSWEPWWPNDSAGANAVAWRADPGEAAERFMRHLIGDDRWERLPPSSREARRAEGPAMLGEMIDIRAQPAWQAQDIRVPVLAVHGEHGAQHHAEAMAVLCDRVSDAEVVAIDDARHFGPNTHPDRLADLIDDFVARRIVTK